MLIYNNLDDNSLFKLLCKLNENLVENSKKIKINQYKALNINNPNVHLATDKMLIWDVLLFTQKAIHLESKKEYSSYSKNELSSLSNDDLITYYKHLIKPHTSKYSNKLLSSLERCFSQLAFLESNLSKNESERKFGSSLRFILFMCNKSKLRSNINKFDSYEFISCNSNWIVDYNLYHWLDNKDRSTWILPYFFLTEINLLNKKIDESTFKSLLDYLKIRIDYNHSLMFGRMNDNKYDKRNIHPLIDNNLELMPRINNDIKVNIIPEYVLKKIITNSWDVYTMTNFMKKYISESGPDLYDLITDHHYQIKSDFLKNKSTKFNEENGKKKEMLFLSYLRLDIKEFIKYCLYCSVGIESTYFSKINELFMQSNNNVTTTGISILSIEIYKKKFIEAGSLYLYLNEYVNKLRKIVFGVSNFQQQDSTKQPFNSFFPSYLGLINSMVYVISIYGNFIDKLLHDKNIKLLDCLFKITKLISLLRFVKELVEKIEIRYSELKSNTEIVDYFVKLSENEFDGWRKKIFLMFLDSVISPLIVQINNWILNGKLPPEECSFFISIQPLNDNSSKELNFRLQSQTIVLNENFQIEFLKKHAKAIFNCGITIKFLSDLNKNHFLLSTFCDITPEQSVISYQKCLYEKLLLNFNYYHDNETYRDSSIFLNDSFILKNDFKYISSLISVEKHFKFQIDDSCNEENFENFFTLEKFINKSRHYDCIQNFFIQLEHYLSLTLYHTVSIVYDYLNKKYQIKSYVFHIIQSYFLFQDEFLSELTIFHVNNSHSQFHFSSRLNFLIESFKNSLSNYFNRSNDFNLIFEGNLRKNSVLPYNFQLIWKRQIPYQILLNDELFSSLNKVFNIFVNLMFRVHTLTHFLTNLEKVNKSSDSSKQNENFLFSNVLINIVTHFQRYLEKLYEIFKNKATKSISFLHLIENINSFKESIEKSKMISSFEYFVLDFIEVQYSFISLNSIESHCKVDIILKMVDIFILSNLTNEYVSLKVPTSKELLSAHKIVLDYLLGDKLI